MTFLVVASITVPCASATERPVRVGTSGRAFAGNLRSTVRAEKNEWEVTTGLLLDADATTLRSATDLAEQVTCSGDLLRASTTCEVEVIEDAKVYTSTADGKGFMRALTLVIREV